MTCAYGDNRAFLSPHRPTRFPLFKVFNTNYSLNPPQKTPLFTLEHFSSLLKWSWVRYRQIAFHARRLRRRPRSPPAAARPPLRGEAEGAAVLRPLLPHRGRPHRQQTHLRHQFLPSQEASGWEAARRLAPSQPQARGGRLAEEVSDPHRCCHLRTLTQTPLSAHRYPRGCHRRERAEEGRQHLSALLPTPALGLRGAHISAAAAKGAARLWGLSLGRGLVV